MFNVCFCGAPSGFPHRPECPRPLYRGTTDQAARWIDDRDALRKQIAAAETETARTLDAAWFGANLSGMCSRG